MRITCHRHPIFPEGQQQHHIHRPPNWQSQSITSQHHKYTNKHCDGAIAICSILFHTKIHSNLTSKFYPNSIQILHFHPNITLKFLQILRPNSPKFYTQFLSKYAIKISIPWTWGIAAVSVALNMWSIFIMDCMSRHIMSGMVLEPETFHSNQALDGDRFPTLCHSKHIPISIN